MRHSSFAVLALALVLAAGCAEAVNKKMDSWMGHSFSELLSSWGPPSQVFDDGNGGRILVYTRTRSFTVPGSATTQTTGYIAGSNIFATSATTYNPSQSITWQAYRMFWVNADGKIYKWSWRGR